MKKNKSIVIFICIVLSLCLFVAACDVDENNQESQNKLTLEYINASDIILWKADWAEKFALFVYLGDSEDGFLIYKESDISAADNHRKLDVYYEQSGKYFFVVYAYKGEYVARETLVTDIIVDTIVQYPDDEYQEPVENETPEGFKSDVGRLKKTYYHIAKSDKDLTISLANQNGIKSVSGFGLSQYGDWSYDKDNNSLIIDQVYLKKFSKGARLGFEVEYNDGRNGIVSVELVDELPFDIIKGGITITGSQIYSNNTSGVISILNLALNYDIFLGLDNQVADQGSAYYVKNISIDGKRLLSSAYGCWSKESKITLTANKILSGLSYGIHLLEIYTTRGKSEVWLNVRGASNNPCNVEIDYDDCYPNVYVKWDMFVDDAQDFIVKIGGVEYSQKDYPQLFDGYKFDATGKIKYGEEVRVAAVVNGKEEISLGSFLNVDIANPLIQRHLSYNNFSFDYLGSKHNTFIDNYQELKDLVAYSLIHYDNLTPSTKSGFEKMWTIYLNPSFTNTATALDDNIKSAELYFNEGVKSKWQVVKEDDRGNAYKVYFTIYSTCIPDNVVRTCSVKENPYNNAHFSQVGRKDDFDNFAVNQLTASASVTYSEELYRALERGVRPEPVQNSPAQLVFDRAKSILRRIVDDGMNDFQKVHAICDWLSCYVKYNWDLADEINNASASSDEYNKYYSYRELYLEGAILDGIALCNGYAKAVSLLCGIEGIECYKIKGASGAAQHAWNKVCIDGSWYVVDSTWANERVQLGGINSQKCEVLKHNTLFMTDEQSGNMSGGAHYEMYLGDYSGYFAGSQYDVFANTYFTYDGNIYDMVIDNQRELEILLRYMLNSKCKDMGHNSYLVIDVRCDNTLLISYIENLKKESADIFENYTITTKFASTYGSMTSIVIYKS